MTGSTVHDLGYEHGGAGPQSPVRLLLLVLLILAVEVVALTVQTPALVGHLACDPELLGHGPVQLLAGLVQDLGAFLGRQGSLFDLTLVTVLQEQFTVKGVSR